MIHLAINHAHIHLLHNGKEVVYRIAPFGRQGAESHVPLPLDVWKTTFTNPTTFLSIPGSVDIYDESQVYSIIPPEIFL